VSLLDDVSSHYLEALEAGIPDLAAYLFAPDLDPGAEQLPTPCLALFFAGGASDGGRAPMVTERTLRWDLRCLYAADAEGAERACQDLAFKAWDLLERLDPGHFPLIGKPSGFSVGRDPDLDAYDGYLSMLVQWEVTVTLPSNPSSYNLR